MEGEKRIADGALVLSGGQLGLQPKSDSLASAQPASPIVGRTEFWSDGGVKNGTATGIVVMPT